MFWCGRRRKCYGEPSANQQGRLKEGKVKIKQDGEKYILEMKDSEEFSALFVLLGEYVPKMLMNINAFNFGDPRKVEKTIKELYKQAHDALKTVPMDDRRKNFFRKKL